MSDPVGGSVLDASVVSAYLAAHYRVDCSPPFVMRVGQVSPGLARLYESQRVRSAAFVTACNPWGELLSAPANQAAQSALQQELQAVGAIWFHGAGEDPAGLWPGEESMLVLGLARGDAMQLGLRHRQNAIVWAGPDAVPELLLLR